MTIVYTLRAQVHEPVQRALKLHRVGKAVMLRSEYAISEAVYLGTVRDKQGKVRYQVVKEFVRLKAANVYHGHSTIYFLTPEGKLAASVNVDMPDELPYKLSKNNLCFRSLENGILRPFIINVDTIPNLFCISNCYEIAYP